MNELNRPLGKKPEPAHAKKPRTNLALLLGIAGVVLGGAAVALFAYQSMAPKTVIVADNTQSAGKVEIEPQIKAEAPEASKDNNTDLASELYPDTNQGLQPLKPDGAIAVPTPRPPKAKPQESGLAHLPDPDFSEDTADGVLPKRAEDGRRPMDVYSRIPDTTGNFGVARIAIIVGGMGLSQTGSQQAIRRLPPAITLAFAPYGNSLQRWMQDARRNGHEILLQIPLEPFGYPNNSPGPHTLNIAAGAAQNIEDLHWSMTKISNYVGVMNYQGAKFMADQEALKPLFDELAQRGLLYVDDGSAPGTRTQRAAEASILPYAIADIQIDAVRTRNDIAKQLEQLAQKAKRTGLAIGVASAFTESIEMIADFAEKAAKDGIEITPITSIVKDLENDR